MKRLCETCDHFSPAHTCIEKPTWGHCLRLTHMKSGHKMEKAAPVFTWADGFCGDFRAKSAVSARR